MVAGPHEVTGVGRGTAQICHNSKVEAAVYISANTSNALSVFILFFFLKSGDRSVIRYNILISVYIYTIVCMSNRMKKKNSM